MRYVPLLVGLLCLLPGVAAAQWSDDFDSYPLGPLAPQGGWETWDLDPAFNGDVSDVMSRSGSQSLEMGPATDIVYRYGPDFSGTYTIIGHCYIPSASLVGSQFFILLNNYQPTGVNNWSLELEFVLATNTLRDAQVGSTTLPVTIVRDAWVEVRVDVDLNTNMQSVYYNGGLFVTKSWTEGSSGGGFLQFGTIDLFSDGGDVIYWDDMFILAPVPVEGVTWSGLKDRYR